MSQHSGALEAAAASRHSRGQTPQMRLPDGKSGDQANPPSYTTLTSLKLCLLNSREHTFACFISSSAISIKFLRNAAILFCLKLISSVEKEKNKGKRYTKCEPSQPVTSFSNALMFQEFCCAAQIIVFDQKKVQELVLLFLDRDAVIT